MPKNGPGGGPPRRTASRASAGVIQHDGTIKEPSLQNLRDEWSLGTVDPLHPLRHYRTSMRFRLAGDQ